MIFRTAICVVDHWRGMESIMKIAQFQTHVYENKRENIDQMKRCLEKAAAEGADLAAFGEMFCCPYESANFPKYAEEKGGYLWTSFSRLAAEYGIWISAGSIPERGEDGGVYNTAFVFDRNGEQAAAHRKMHLFDIDVTGGQSFRESDTLSAGRQVTVFDTEFGKIGLCICFDIRFPELVRLMVLQGAETILVPAAFNRTTGPAHWDILFRCRAVDNQCYMIGTSPAADENAGYIAWGHSLVVSPWGDTLSEMDDIPGLRVTSIDREEVRRVRRELPLLSARRTDLYEVETIGEKAIR